MKSLIRRNNGLRAGFSASGLPDGERSASRRLFVRFLGLAPSAVLLGGLLVGAGPLAGQAAAATTPTTVRWFVGLGSGTQPNQIAAEQAFVANYNATNSDHIRIVLEIVPNPDAADALKAEILSGNPPDIIGPVGNNGRNGFNDQFLDLTPEIAKFGTNLSGYDPALVNYFKEGSSGQIGLPYLIYPGFIFYNKDIFSAAGLPDLPTAVGAKYQGHDWTWDELSTVAKQLTLDSQGKKSTDLGFDPDTIVQFGMDFQWADARRMASCFDGGTFVADDGTAQIPAAYRAAWNWYYDAMWTSHFAPTGPYISSPLLNNGTTISSGRIAMSAAWGWGIPSYGTAGDAAFGHWDMAVMPSYNGQTSSPLDADTFTISKVSTHPDQAYKAMLAIEANSSLKQVYGGMPARTAEQAAYFSAFDSQLEGIFPDNGPIHWSVLQEMEKYPAVPGQESGTPSRYQIQADTSIFYTKLQNTSGLDVDDETDSLLEAIQGALTGTRFHAIAPARALDSRISIGADTFHSQVKQSFQVAGLHGIPADAVAVTGNVTIVGQTAGGFVTIAPSLDSGTQPETSTINFPVGDVRANGATVALSPDGDLDAMYWTSLTSDTTHILFDVTGYFSSSAGATFHYMAPTRVLDSRTSLGADKFHSRVKRSFQVGGLHGVPVDAVAVTGNVTIVGQAASGYVAVAPSLTSGTQPSTSTINFPVGDVRANGVTVPLGVGGKLDAMYWTGRSGDTVNVILDVTGYFANDLTGSTFHAITPGRVLDSRTSLGAGKFHSRVKQSFQVSGLYGIPDTEPTRAVAVTGNVTVVGQTASGYVAVAPSLTSGTQPSTSTVNFPVRDVRANGVLVCLGAGGMLDAMYWTGRTGDKIDVLFDVTGYFN